jgi:hypothetical protein
LTLPAPAPKTVVIRAGRLLDVKTGKTLSNQTILIQGDKIERGTNTHEFLAEPAPVR